MDSDFGPSSDQTWVLAVQLPSMRSERTKVPVQPHDTLRRSQFKAASRTKASL